MLRVQRLWPIVALVLMTSCDNSPKFDAASETKKLLDRDAEWAAIATAGTDVEKTISYWSDDAVLIPPGQPKVEGKAAIREYVKGAFATPGFKIRWKSDKATFSADGKMAFMTSTNTTTLTGPDGAPMVIPGRGLTIWRVDTDGAWRCVMDIWNDPPSDKPAGH